MSLHIKKLTPTSPDLLSLAEWFHAEWGYYHPGQTLEGRIADLKSLCKEDQIPMTWVAFDKNEMVGSVALTYDDLPTYPHFNPWVASLYVKNEARGKGYGSILFQHVMKEALQLGLKEIFLFTKDQEKLYGKFGWELIERAHYLGDEIAIMRYRFV